MKRPDYTGATPKKLAKALFKPLERSVKERPKIQKRAEGKSKSYRKARG